MSQEGAAVPASAKSSWSSFLKSITSFSGDISTLTAPPFILSGTSLTEYSSYWAEHPSIFVAPAKEKDPSKRALLVLKWFLTTLKQQYSSRSESLGTEKKPLNPFLGELFLGKWVDDAGTTKLVSEQVSHHPPVTAYCIWNDEHGVRLQGYNGQKASISKTLTITIKQVGYAILHLNEYDEDYLITLPNLHIEGVYTGAPFVELDSSSYITSSSGFTAKIDYSGRGWISGKKNTFSATLYSTEKPKDVHYYVDGQWNEAFKIKDSKKQEIDAYDASQCPTTKLMIAPIEEQHPLESRRAWQHVAAAINKGDMEVTQAEKSKIENEQRDLRKKEKEEGVEWERKFFTRRESDEIFDKLSQNIGYVADPKQTNGVWVWDQAKAEKAIPPIPQ
ncbi:uncharacterized protein PV09_01329 [Verruconis gallopava]|uniref:Oxysterol-binding protein n=1 Tax=Verruconis gallopava TaxID=253628 RepID=A0A0D1Y044_9PEZI|nr:uncharacterized protein PV09_01329 [Verruconis gallopava]KIW08426.1 hypothetical protein PV09_01329 [Verruconis gallopava]